MDCSINSPSNVKGITTKNSKTLRFVAKNVKNVDKNLLCSNINSTLSQKRQKFTNFDLKIPIFQRNKLADFECICLILNIYIPIFYQKIG